MKKYNDSLYKEYTYLKDHPVVITKTKIITRVDTVYAYISDMLVNDSIIAWRWTAEDSTYYCVNGRSMVFKNATSSPQTIIDNVSVQEDLTMDIVDDGQTL